MLTLNNVEVIYDRVFLAIRGVSLNVKEGGMVALLGSNGAGKSTTLKSISGLLAPERGEVTRGSVEFMGESLLPYGAAQRVTKGLVHVIEGRRIFQHLTPDENLYAAFNPRGTRARLDRKSTRLNSSHVAISYAVFCLKKKKDSKLSSH